MRKTISKIKNLFTVFSLIIAVSVSAYGEEHVHTVEREIVKVGYYENEAFQEGASENAVKSGYGYEYLQKLASITGWQYEYIYGSWSEIYDSFINGEIDLLGGLGYSESRLSSISYPDYPMGYESYYLYVRSDDDSITMDFDTLRGKKIGAIPGLLFDHIQNWLTNHNIEAQIVIFDDVHDRDLALENGSIDAFIGEGTSVSARGLKKPLIKISSVNMYLCVTKKRPDILKELNIALSELDSNNPYYINQLSEKYFKNSAVSLQVSSAEANWLSIHNDTLRVGYMDNFLPYCGTDKSGKTIGILVDTMEVSIKKLISPNPIKVTYKSYSNTSEMIEAIHNHDIDVIFPVSNNIYFMEQNDLFQSKEVITSAMNMVYLDKITDKTTETIAINKNNQIQYDYAMTYMPDSKIIFYDSVAECLESVSHGTAGCAILSGLRASVILREPKYVNLKYIELPENTVKCFGVSTHNIGVLTLLDRALNTLDLKDTLTFTYNYLETDIDYSIKEFLKRNMDLFFLILTVLISIFITVTAIIISKHHKEQIYYKFAYKDSLTGAYNRHAYQEDIAAFNVKNHKNYACVSMDLNGLKKTNDELGHAAGDELISEACRLITQIMGNSGKIYRTGGDEFCALLKIGQSEFEILKQKLEEACSAWKGKLSDTLRISVGAAYKSECSSDDLMDLWKLADKRMYEEKSFHYRKIGVDRRGQNDAHKALCAMYTKILKINLTDDSCQIINMDASEQTIEKGFSPKISQWLKNFGDSGQVHPEDLDYYHKKTDLKYMQDYFKDGRKLLTIAYRRKYDDVYKNSVMQIIPAYDYEAGNQSLYLYVNSID